MYSCLYYNLYVAASITTTGRSLVSAMGTCFEQFLANNVKFESLNQIITFIDNVIREERNFDDNLILDRNISYQECFCKLIYTIGFEWIPDEEDLNIIWDLLCKLDQTSINRIYYKNNLYEFISNSKIMNAIIGLLKELDSPFMNPNKPPKEISVELDALTEIVLEYVFYNYMVIDRQWYMDNMIKSVTMLSDTDSTIVSLDAFYQCVLTKVKDIDFKPLYAVDLVEFFEADEFGDIPPKALIEFEEPYKDYDFFNDKVIEMQRQIDLTTIIPQDGLRYSIINILAYILDKVVNKNMELFCKLSNSTEKGNDSCLIIAKNEYLFKRALLTLAKKNYSTIQELQEGNIVDFNHRLDIKGLAIDKSTMNAKTRKQLKQLLLEDILDCETVDQVKIIKDLAILENSIYKSLASGDKEYYKPATIKSMGTYKDPMRIQGIKGAVAWNAIKDTYLEAIDLTERNAVDIVKVNINPTTIEKIKDTNPEAYARLIEVVGTNKCPTANTHFAEAYKGVITALSIPKDVKAPEWILQFIDYTTIINDNLCNFPFESIGGRRLGKDKVNYTNIVNL